MGFTIEKMIQRFQIHCISVDQLLWKWKRCAWVTLGHTALFATNTTRLKERKSMQLRVVRNLLMLHLSASPGQRIFLDVTSHFLPPPASIHFAFCLAINTLPSCGGDIYCTWPSTHSKQKTLIKEDACVHIHTCIHVTTRHSYTGYSCWLIFNRQSCKMSILLHRAKSLNKILPQEMRVNSENFGTYVK